MCKGVLFCLSVCAPRVQCPVGQERALDSLDLELQLLAPMWVLGTEPSLDENPVLLTLQPLYPFFETGSCKCVIHYIDQAGLKQRTACLCRPSARIRVMHHYSWFEYFLYNKLSF